MQVRFNVDGITCGGCVATITNVLNNLPDENKFLYIDNKPVTRDKEPVRVFKSSVNLPNKKLIIIFDEQTTTKLRENTKEIIVKELSDFGYECTEEVDEDPIKISFEKERPTETTNLIINHPSMQLQLKNNLPDEKKIIKKNNSKNEDALFDPLKWLLSKFGIEISSETSHAIQALTGIILGLISMGLMLSGLVIPSIAINILMGFNTTMTLFLGLGSYWDAIKKLTTLKMKTEKLGWRGTLSVFNMHVLFAMSTLIIIGISIASLFIPGLHSMIDASLLIYGFMHMGQVIKHSVQEESKNGELYEDRCAAFVDKKNANNDFENCASSQLQPGDVIRIMPGMVIPVDGKSNGNASIQTDLLGDSRAVMVPLDGYIAAGSIARNEFEMTVTKCKAESYLADQRKACLAGMDSVAPIEEDAAKYLQFLLPVVFLVAIISGGLLAYFVGPVASAQIIALLLSSVCACSLGLLTPLAIEWGMIKTYEHGFYYKSKPSLQLAKDIDTVVFDLNGTLTLGEHKILGSRFTNSVKDDTDKLLGYFALLEKDSPHAVGQLVHERYKKYIKKENISDIKEKHCGRSAIINKRRYLIGSKDYLDKHNISIPEEIGKDIEREIKKELKNHGNPFQVTYLVRDNEVVGYLKISDPVRDEAEFVINNLRSKNKKIYILTGADEKTANAYAARFNISPEYIFSGYEGFRRPEDTAHLVEKYKWEEYFSNQLLEENKIYLSVQNKKLCYTMINVRGKEITERIDDIVPEETDLESLTKFAPHVLAHASNSGHIRDKTKINRMYELMEEHGTVMIVGDSGNDAAAFSARGCYGVAINSSFSKPETAANAKAVVFRNSLLPLLGVFAVAEETINSIMHSVFGSQIFNAGAMAASITLTALGFMVHPAIGAAMMFLQMIFFFGYLLYVHNRELPYEEKYQEMQDVTSDAYILKNQKRMRIQNVKNNEKQHIILNNNDEVNLLTDVDSDEDKIKILINNESLSDSDELLRGYSKISLKKQEDGCWPTLSQFSYK